MEYSKEFTKGPSYILPNGEFFNLEENGFNSHFAYEGYLKKNGELDHSYKRQITLLYSWIRINDRKPFEVLADLPLTEITEEQYKSLELFLNTLIDRGIYFIELGIEPKGSELLKWSKDVIFYNKFDFFETSVNEIIAKIKKFYKDRG